MPVRPSCSRLIASQFERTRPAVSASTSPNTCGCRRTSFSWIDRAACWRSPSSSSSFASSPVTAASATSYASSTVCGTIVRAVCSRSHGQSRRRRRVSSCSSSMASPRPGTTLLFGGRRGRRRRRRRRVAGLVRDLAVEVLLQLVRPVRHRLVPLLLEELLADRLLDLREGRDLGGLDGPHGLDDVVAELGLYRVGDLSGLQGERGLVERPHGLALGDRQLAADLL